MTLVHHISFFCTQEQFNPGNSQLNQNSVRLISGSIKQSIFEYFGLFKTHMHKNKVIGHNVE